MPVRATEADLELFCTQLVSDYDLALPLDPWELCRRVGSRRGRPVRPLAAELGGPHSVGHLIALPDRDTIFYDSAAPRPLQVQIICHELMHLLRGHLDDESELTCGALLPDDSPTPPPGVGGLYTTWQEWEAEVGATMLARLANARPQPARAPDEEGMGLAAAFGLQQSPWEGVNR